MSQNKKQEKQEKTIDPKVIRRVILQAFVWVLVIAFVSTIGVMWDDQGMGVPTVVETSGSKIDLSPRQLYMLEFERLDETLREQNPNIDPRTINKYLVYASLTNTADMAVRQQFYNDIQLKPSDFIKSQMQGANINRDVLDFQYAESAFLSPLGALSSMGAPTVSDMYAYSDLKNFAIATEMIVFNKTNFLTVKVPEIDQENHYLENIGQWIEYQSVKNFQVSNRGQARRVIKTLKELGLEEGILAIAKDPKIGATYTPELMLTAGADTFDHMIEVVKAYKEKPVDTAYAISEPIYEDGSYHVSIIEAVTPFVALTPPLKANILQDYVLKNYKKLAKTHATEWDKATKAFEASLVSNVSFTTVVAENLGAVNHITTPFTMLNRVITNVTGAVINLPVLSDKNVLGALLDTPKQGISPVVDVKDEKELYIAFRPLFKNYTQDEEAAANVINDAALFQEVNNYKLTVLQTSLNNENKKKRYKLKTYPEVLTNLIPVY